MLQFYKRLLLFLVFITSLFATVLTPPSFLQDVNSRNIQYFYDDKGRLFLVSEPPCRRTLYQYDDAGNTTRIEETDGQLRLDSVDPPSAISGRQVVISGFLFRTKREENTVTFNNVKATVVLASERQLVVAVPNLPPGNVTIVVESPPCKPATINFTVIDSGASLTISPTNAIVPVRQTIQFTAEVKGLIDKSVIWAVNDIVGGNTVVGTITQTGFYTAPNAVPNGNIKVSATTTQAAPSTNAQLTANAFVTVQDNVAVTLVVSPATATVVSGSGDTVPFIANVSGLDSGTFDVQWSINMVIGGNSTFGLITQTGVYSAPSTGSGTVSVRATIINNPIATGIFGEAVVIIQEPPPEPPTISIDPDFVFLQPNETQQFTSIVTGLANTNVIWQVDEGANFGTITNTGFYTAPDTIPQGNATVRATSVVLPSLTATATVSFDVGSTRTNSKKKDPPKTSDSDNKSDKNKKD